MPNKKQRLKMERPKRKRFAASLQPLTYYDKSRMQTIGGDKDGPISKTDRVWVPVRVAACIFECSHQTIRLLHIDGKVKGVKYPQTGLMVWLPDVNFYAIDEDDRFNLDLYHKDRP